MKNKSMIEPPFAYTGSKFKLLSQLDQYLTSDKENFVDLFSGGGSVYTKVLDKYAKVYVNDIIKELIGIQEALSMGDTIISEMKEVVVEKDDALGYAKLRESFNKTRNPAELWALMLNCTNNMMRFNKQFNFNQTFGKRTISDKMSLRINSFSKTLQENRGKLVFSSHNFVNFPLMENTLYYCDPPYSNTSAGYNCYWNKDDDMKLFDYLKRIEAIGSKFVVSGTLSHDGKSCSLLDCLKNSGYKMDVLTCDYNKVSRKGKKETIEVVCYN